MADTTYTKEDIEKNKALAIIGYLGLLFLVPLLAAKDSPFAQFHAKQALTNCILLIIPFVNIVGFVFAIIGIINAANGKAEKLPVIGDFQLIK